MNEVERRRRREQAGEARQQLQDNLREEYLDDGVPDEIASRVFQQAWESGHASGSSEVEMVYADWAEVVNAAYLAGVKAGVKEAR